MTGGEKRVMPIYEYVCQKCKTHLEVMQKVSDKPLARHGKCGGKLEKQWSAPSFQFKGSGWYVTDYAGKKGESKAEGKSGEGKSGSSETKSESASAAEGSTKSEPSSGTSPKAGNTSKQGKAGD